MGLFNEEQLREIIREEVRKEVAKQLGKSEQKSESKPLSKDNNNDLKSAIDNLTEFLSGENIEYEIIDLTEGELLKKNLKKNIDSGSKSKPKYNNNPLGIKVFKAETLRSPKLFGFNNSEMEFITDRINSEYFFTISDEKYKEFVKKGGTDDALSRIMLAFADMNPELVEETELLSQFVKSILTEEFIVFNGVEFKRLFEKTKLYVESYFDNTIRKCRCEKCVTKKIHELKEKVINSKCNPEIMASVTEELFEVTIWNIVREFFEIYMDEDEE